MTLFSLFLFTTAPWWAVVIDAIIAIVALIRH